MGVGAGDERERSRRDQCERSPRDLRERLTSVGPRVVRSLRVTDSPAHGGPADPLVVILPGLGLPFYTLPTARSIVQRGLDCEVLDLPGFGSTRPRATRPNIHAIGLAAAGWVRERASDRPVVVLGHSTGSQAALTAGLALAGERRSFALVMAGPTFAPSQRRLLPLAATTPLAYRNDRPREIDPVQIRNGRTAIAVLLQSGMRDAPERRIAVLPAPLTITSGVRDAFAPTAWLDTLATSAVAAASTRTSLLGGSHNNLFTHPDEVADLPVLAAADAVAWR
jgi:pimeloyl-ACP methyl ester carboxylesterase